MINAIRHRGAVLIVNISIVQDINNNQKFAICAGLPGTVAGVRVVGSIYLGNALAVEQAREQSVESAQPLSSSSTSQPQPEPRTMRYHLDETGRVARGIVEELPSREFIINPADEQRILNLFPDAICVDRTQQQLDMLRENSDT